MTGAYNGGRIALIDAYRGLVIILMLVYHFLFDLYLYRFITAETLFSTPLDLMQLFIAVGFILVSGICSRMTRSNIRRGLIVAACAVAVTVATYVFGAPVWFGVLHFLALAMILYGLLGRFIDRIPRPLAPCIYLPLALLTYPLLNMRFPVKGLFWLGFMSGSFTSSDYFPLMPWFFVFLLGTWLGGLIKDGRFPGWFYTARPPLLPWLGRHSLIIYMAHQPVLTGITYLIYRFCQS